MGLARFMSGPVGRIARIAVGIVLVVIGASMGGAGWILAVVGLLPIAAGVFNFCLIGPIIGAPFSGAKCRTS